MKIGFIDRSDASWSAGASYTRSVVHALADGLPESDELFVLGGRGGVSDLPGRARAVRVESPVPTARDLQAMVEEQAIDVLLPVTEILTNQTRCARIGWIPDFQHRRLPQYYSEEQRAKRDDHFQMLLESCDAMMFSSKAVLADFRELYPDFDGPAAVVHFASSLAYRTDSLEPDPGAMLGKYRLPPVFALVINQFWRHKNHRLVVEAVARARETNPDVHVVMAGMLSDSRDITNAHISEIVRRVFTERLFQNLSILGEVPAEDLQSLLRAASLVIQPSEFEGWSTTVEDALALGRPLACSDIATHREQAPDAFFFGVREPSALAEFLARRDWSNPVPHDSGVESGNLAAERSRGAEWGAGLVDLGRRALERHRRDPDARSRKKFSIDELKRHPAAYIEYLETQVARLGSVEVSLRNTLKCRMEEFEKALGSAAKTCEETRLRLVDAMEEAQAFREKYWRERQKPLRQHMREALLGRKD